MTDEPVPDLPVQQGSDEPAIPAGGDTDRPKRGRVLPKWEQDARDRVRTAIRRFSKPLTDLVARDANEGDTRLLVTDFLCDGLGYDKYEDLTTEWAVRGEFADYGIRIDKQLVAFLECKRATTKLAMKHLRQVEMYAVNEGVEWVILTNGSEWRVYHLTAGLPVVIDLAFTVDLLDPQTSVTRKVDRLFYLSRDALKRGQIEELWRTQLATSPRQLAQALLSDTVVAAPRKEIRRTSKYAVEEKELARLLTETVIRPDCFT
jgi:predicted type IV restriction endonuclease